MHISECHLSQVVADHAVLIAEVTDDMVDVVPGQSDSTRRRHFPRRSLLCSHVRGCLAELKRKTRQLKGYYRHLRPKLYLIWKNYGYIYFWRQCSATDMRIIIVLERMMVTCRTHVTRLRHARQSRHFACSTFIDECTELRCTCCLLRGPEGRTWSHPD